MHHTKPVQYMKWQIIACFYLLAYLPTSGQTVGNLRTDFDQSSQIIRISYDLKGLHFKKAIQIRPYLVWSDSSTVWLKSLSGDYGWLERGGKNKLVVWNPFEDGVDNLVGAQIKIETQVRAAQIPHFWGLAVHGSNSAPIGLKVIGRTSFLDSKKMRLLRLSFFAGVRVGNLPPSYRYSVSAAGEMDYRESGVYEFTDQRKIAGFAITAGQILQLGRNIYGYAGLGYGVEQLFWEYQSFNLSRNLIGSAWALDEHINRKGLVIDLGTVVRLGPVLLDVGLSTIQFKSYQVTGGVGIAFLKNKKP